MTYTPTDTASFEAQMRQSGLPEQMIRLSTGFYADIRDGQFAEVTSELEQLLGRRPSSLQEGLKTVFAM